MRSSFDVIAMSKVLTKNQTFNSMNTLTSWKFGQPLNYVGLSFTACFTRSPSIFEKKPFSWDGYFEYLQMIPQKITLPNGIEAKTNGFNFGWTMLGADVIKSKKVDLIVCGGFNTGRIWLQGSDAVRQKNPYFAPMITLIPRLVLGKFAVQLRGSFDYDITKSYWKRKGFRDAELQPLPNFKSTGCNVSVGLGYVFG